MAYLISGIQQIGVGVENFTQAWKWYAEMFHMDVRVLEDDTVAERMLRYTGGKPQKRHACIAMNLQGGEYLISMSCTGFEQGEHTVYHRLYDLLNITVISNKNTVGVYDMDSETKAVMLGKTEDE